MRIAEMDIPRPWRLSAECILTNAWRKILVIGASDRGKSTYCAFLAGYLCDSGARVAFVDADVGQKDVGPPATVSLAYVQDGCSLSQAESAGGYFVGDTSPIGRFLPMVVGTRRLVTAAQAPFVIIDTSGLVHGAGQVLKQYQIDAVQPHVIIALEINRELDSLLASHRHYHLIRLAPSVKAAGKSAKARRLAREQAFRRYFDGAHEMTLDVARLIFQRTPLFIGRPVMDERFLYAEQSTDGWVAVSRAGEALQHKKGWRILPADYADGLLCGLADRAGEYLGLAIIHNIDFRQRRITLYTPVRKGAIGILQFGDLFVTREGRERRLKA